MVLHLLKPTSGKVFYEGRDTSTFKAKDLLGFRRHVQPVFQNPYGSLDPMYSIFRSIEEPLRIHKIGDSKWRANRVKELLDMVEMPASVMGRYPNELSGGQRQRIAIARAMALDRTSSCAMRPCPPSMCWCRIRCCACSTTCRPKRA